MPKYTFSFNLWRTRAYAVAIGCLLLLKAYDCCAQGPMSITVTPANPTCQYNNGSFIVKVTGGTPPYGYLSYAAQQGNTTGIFAELAAGTYDINVYDATNAKATSSVVLTGPGTSIAYLTTTVVNASGCNTNDGLVTLTPSGGIPPYQYSIDNGMTFQSGNVFPNLSPGTYGFFVKDGNGCITAPWSGNGISYADFEYDVFSANVSVGAPSCPVQLATLPAGAMCNNNFIEVNYATGGTPPYTFSIDGGPFGQLTGDGFDFLSSGKHTVEVKDATGVINSYTYYFPAYCPVYAADQPSQCGTSNGTLTVIGGSGLPPLSYSIDGTNYQPGNVFTGLAARSYTMIVKDANGATTYGTGTVTGGCPAVTLTATAAECSMATGSIIAAGSGGTAPYTYSIDGVNFQSPVLFSNLKSGSYTVTIKDATGLTATTAVTVPDQCIALEINTEAATCGNANGSLSVNATNGTPPYQYSLDGMTFQASNTFDDIAGGNYTVTVKDVNGNVATVAAALGDIQGAQISAIPTGATCLNDDGGVQINLTGGAPPFKLLFDGDPYAGTKTSWPGLPSGIHNITATDDNGCQTSATVVVPLNNNLTVTAGAGPTTCQGVGITLAITSNGAGFAWTPADGLSSSTVADPVAQPSVTTTYTVTATLGVCTRTADITVAVLPAPVADAGLSDTICTGKSARLQGSGGVQYLWSPTNYLSDPASADPAVEQPASTTTYRLTVTGGNGCQSINSAMATVVVTSPPKVFAGDDTSILIGQPLQLNAVDVDGSGFTTYTWSPAQGLSNPAIADPTAVIAANITYTVIATTPAGCPGAGSIVIEAYPYSDIIVPNAFTPNNDGHNDILKVNAIGIQELKYFRVFNRWDQEVFASQHADDGWNGRVGGQPASMGTYVWMAAGVDFHGKLVQRKGTVILIR